jgi:UDP-2,4-diacetamido-2,4,6-trideoxy-beta-L-altropyranose hydrolase
VSNQNLLIRADANTGMGTGHVMRCLALAQAWQAAGDQVTFVTACDSPGLRQWLIDNNCEVVALSGGHPDPDDWALTSGVLARYPTAWVVLDGYHFEPAYQLKVKAAGHPLLMVDDIAHMDYYHADLLLNQNINAADLTYRHNTDTRLLLGPHYALLRREFWQWRGWRRDIPAVARKVLVTLGGSDPDNQTHKVIQALNQVGLEGLEATVVVGASNPHWDMLQTVAQGSPVTIKLVRNVTNMPELMAWADVAIAAGGSTCWELAMLGLPSLLIILAENQAGIARTLQIQNIAVNLGWFKTLTVSDVAIQLAALLASVELRQASCRRGQELVDGKGGLRLVYALGGAG